MFKAVLFDLWETLIQDKPERAQPRRVWRSTAVQAVLQRHGTHAPLDAIQVALDASGFALVQLHDQGMDLDTGGRSLLFIEKLLEHAAVNAPESALRELEDIITSMPLDIAPLVAPFAVEATAGVKARGMATALVCNAGFTTTPHLLPMLSSYGLSAHLDVMVFSDQLGYAKPDPRIFAQALDGLGMAAADCAFVGDNPHTDIAGAQAVGMFAIQVGAKEHDGVKPDARIDGLSELLDVIDSHS